MSAFDFDLLVIGAGSAGVRLSRMVASTGKKVAVIEANALGGTCVNVGCVPKKLFVYASEVAEFVEQSRGFGWQLNGDLSFDWPTLRDNKNTEIARLNRIYQGLLENAGVTIIRGQARFVDAHSVQVGEQIVRAEKIAICTGSKAVRPEFPGAEHCITSDDLFYLERLPTRAVVVGGGYIAVEMAGILHGLGVETTLLYRGDLLLKGFDHEIRAFVQHSIQQTGIDLQLNDNLAQVQKHNQDLQLTLTSGKTLNADLVLLATGREANTAGLALDKAGVEIAGNAEVIIDAHYRTSVPNIFALGDVTGTPQLTPVATAEAMYLARKEFGLAGVAVPLNYELIPTAVFCQPNVATVGLTEAQAKQKFGDIAVFTTDFKPLKHTLSGASERCLLKLVVNRSDDKVVGAHMVGHEAGEIIQGIAIAMMAGATKSQFDQTIGIHPTTAEEFVTLRQERSN